MVLEAITMQMEEAALLRATTKPCPNEKHKWEKEYHFGADTGDYVCTVCGETIWGEELKKQKNKKPN